MITFELYEMARRRAGIAEVEVDARTLGEALAALAEAVPALVPDVIDGNRPAGHWRVGLGGRTWIEDPAHPLSPGDRLVLVSALAGG